MSKRKVTVHVQGYGVIEVRKPKRFNESSYLDGIADAVKQTAKLMDPRPNGRFHPAMGYGTRSKSGTVGS